VEEVRQHFAPTVRSFFQDTSGDPSRLESAELEAYRLGLRERHRQQSDGGKKGAAERKRKATGYPMGNPSRNPMGSPEKSGRQKSSVEGRGEELSRTKLVFDSVDYPNRSLG
jgi:hypothetical protein